MFGVIKLAGVEQPNAQCCAAVVWLRFIKGMGVLLRNKQGLKLQGILPKSCVLVTDGVSSTDPTVVASLLKSSGDNILFTIGVASYSRDQLEPLSSLYTDGSTLFFGISSFQVFDIIASYLKTGR
uniref:(California timema) hypothetical protein n=1 Tax=Timema californicum TaxID=61474 RepID=A0A7R9P709_TIMCA|nr:unnamed protein product [Timema californicum]